jgi:flagellar biogenesis protein FliO
MITFASGWPKLSHRRFKSTAVRLMLVAGMAIAIGTAAACARAGESRASETRAGNRPNNYLSAARGEKVPEGSRQSAATEQSLDAAPGPRSNPDHPASAAGSKKSWKDIARKHNAEKPPETHPTTLSPWTAVSALAVVIGLILILSRIFRRHTPLLGQGLPSEALEVLGRRFLDQRQSIVLLRIGSRILVVGSSTAGMQGLGELSDPVEVDLIAGLCRGNKAGQGLGASFLNMLSGQTRAASKAPSRRNAAGRTQVASRTQIPSRAQAPNRTPSPNRTQSADHEYAGHESPDDRLSDPEQELVRRLRGVPGIGASHAEISENFRD